MIYDRFIPVKRVTTIKEEIELEKELVLNDTVKRLSKLGMTYVVHFYCKGEDINFKIFFYNKDGVCIDVKEGEGSCYQFLLYKRTLQLENRKRFKKVRDNTFIDDLMLYIKGKINI